MRSQAFVVNWTSYSVYNHDITVAVLVDGLYGAGKIVRAGIHSQTILLSDIITSSTAFSCLPAWI
jgi:hypothetical protein